MSVPEVDFNVLPHADGSASYAWHGYDIVGSVNGPIEPQRRDELPQEAFIEVNVRPANGVGGKHATLQISLTVSFPSPGTRERHIESVIHSVLRSVILTHTLPRTLIQVTLQILHTPNELDSSAAPTPQSASHVPILPHLLHAALLALLSANIPLSTVYTAVLCAIDSKRAQDEAVKVSPSEEEVRQATSVHAFVYSASGESLAMESEGRFDMTELGLADTIARFACAGPSGADEMTFTDPGASEPLAVWLRRTVADGVKSS